MSRVQWYYKQLNQVFGPLEFDELWERAQAGALHAHDLIRVGSEGEWQPASSVDGLIPAAAEVEELNDLSELNFQFVDSAAATGSAGPVELTSLDDLQFEFVQDTSRSAGATPVTPAPVTPPQEGPKEWYFQALGQDFGPISLEEILRRAESGEISADDMVKKGTGDYRPASRYPQIYKAIPEEITPVGPLPVEPEGVDYASVRQQKVERRQAKKKRGRQPAPETTAEDLAAEILASPEALVAPASPVIPAPATAAEPEPYNPLAPATALAPPVPSSPMISTPAMSAPVTRPAAFTPPKPAFVPPAKKKSSGPKVSFDFSGLTSALGEQKKLMMTLGGVLLAFVLWKCLPLISLGSEGKYYDQLDALYTEFKTLRDKKASDAEWQAFSEKARTEVEPIVDDLKKTAGSKNRTAQELLWASRDYFTPMLTNCRTGPDNNEKLFARYMSNARRLLDGASPAEIRLPTTEDAKTEAAQNQQANRNGGPE